MSKFWIPVIFLCIFSPRVFAVDLMVDSVMVEGGVGDDGIARGGATAMWYWNKSWFNDGSWYLFGAMEFNVGYWQGDDGFHDNDSLVDVGFAPLVFRFQRHNPIAGMVPFIEAGIGLHGFSETTIEDKNFDINFSFGENIGGGILFGPKQRFELGYRLQHLSNASLGDKNPGINFHVFRLGVHF